MFLNHRYISIYLWPFHFICIRKFVQIWLIQFFVGVYVSRSSRVTRLKMVNIRSEMAYLSLTCSLARALSLARSLSFSLSLSQVYIIRLYRKLSIEHPDNSLDRINVQMGYEAMTYARFLIARRSSQLYKLGKTYP